MNTIAFEKLFNKYTKYCKIIVTGVILAAINYISSSSKDLMLQMYVI